MRNKALIGTLISLAILVVASLYFERKKEDIPPENKVVKVGILQFVTHDALDEIEKGIEDGLADAGYVGKNIQLTVLNAEGDQSKIHTMSKKLVNDRNDVVVGIATPVAQALAAATSDIPVVMGAVSDPLGARLVKNLAKPEANVTGVSNQIPVKQMVELIKKITPNAKKIGMLYSSSEDNSISQVKAFKQYAEAVGLIVEEFAVPSTNEIKTTASVMTGKVDAIFVPQDNTIASAFPTVISEANLANIPVYSSVDSMVKQGSIATISQSQYQLGRETAKVVIQLLERKKVADVPVNIINTGTPTLNLQAAKDLGIKIPQDLLEKADIAIQAQ